MRASWHRPPVVLRSIVLYGKDQKIRKMEKREKVEKLEEMGEWKEKYEI